jgi:hypothetical protein
MHRKKEEVILELELWLKGYEFLKFWSYFCGFSEAMDLFVIIFQILGPNRKFLDCGLISKKHRGFFAKFSEILILAQESLDLELWLKRYEFLKFSSYFCGFSEARDLFVIIFQILRPNQFLDCGLITKKHRGFFAKFPEILI